MFRVPYKHSDTPAPNAKGRLCVSNQRWFPSLLMIGALLAVSPAFAQTKPGAADAANAPSGPVESSLTIGALQIASVPNLEIVGFDIHVEVKSVAYSYFLKNAGAADISVTATIALPELQASGDGSETWTLASRDPENFVGLTVTSAGAPVATTAQLHAFALSLDRLAEIKAEHLPLIPFGADLDKALAALSPEAAGRLAALGLISPPDTAQKTPPIPDWSLSVVRTWRQTLPAGKTTPVVVKFTPVPAQYKIAKGGEQDLEDMKDEVCLKGPTLGNLQARLKSNGAWKVIDISLAGDPPARWVDSPKRTLSVQKPAGEAIVAFCGIDEKSASKPTVLGTVPDDSGEIRIVIFEPAAN